MSELNVYHHELRHNEYEEFYLKYEADKVIAELKKEKEYTITQTAEVINAQERELRHQKYKRCLDEAKWCQAEKDAAFLRYNWDSGRYAVVEFYEKWHKRWLGLAEKFKEAK